MTSFVTAVLVALVLSVGAAGLLDRVQQQVENAYSTGSVRLD
jgi:hypothetical protein